MTRTLALAGLLAAMLYEVRPGASTSASITTNPQTTCRCPLSGAPGPRFAELNYSIMRTLADDGVRTQWYAGDYFGNLFAPKAARAVRPGAR